MQLQRSEKAKLELASKQRTLSVRERSVLFLADGIRTRDELVCLLQGDAGTLQKLTAAGYLLPATSNAKFSVPRVSGFAIAPDAPVKTPSGRLPASANDVLTVSPAQSPSSFASQHAFEKAAASSSDTFEGKRSLATTRMFLFDIVERLFVRKKPDLAVLLRDQLRGAKDRESMLAVARQIIHHVEEIAGPDRADGLSERLAMLLPSEH